jgi:hypothetical protein
MQLWYDHRLHQSTIASIFLVIATVDLECIDVLEE